MKVLGIMLVVLLTAGLAFGATEDTFVSGDTVSFRSIDWDTLSPGLSYTSPTVVTFNYVTRHIKLINLSSAVDCYVDLGCRDADGKRGHVTTPNAVVLVPAMGRVSPNSVELDFSTRNLGFIGSTGSGHEYDNEIHYVVTGEQGDF